MSDIEIEKGIPIPLPRHQQYPFAKMEIGDSFVVPWEKNGQSIVAAMARRAGVGVTTRTFVDDQGRKRIRVWRVT